jgi:hypothetical protein
MTLNKIFFLLPVLFYTFSTTLNAQSGLAGMWEGTITEGGIDGAAVTYKFKLFLEVDGAYLKGRSYVYIRPDSIVHQQLSGKMYEDRSVYLREVNVDKGDPTSLNSMDEMPEDLFTRKYQFVYTRSIWESGLEGFWQQIIPNPEHYSRQRGKIFLKKKESKA